MSDVSVWLYAIIGEVYLIWQHRLLNADKRGAQFTLMTYSSAVFELLREMKLIRMKVVNVMETCFYVSLWYFIC